MDKAIKLAVEGGYEDPRPSAKLNDAGDIEHEKIISDIVRSMQNPVVYSDPEFWRCLGKALGAKPYPRVDKEYIEGRFYLYDLADGEPTWLNYWHRFIDSLAEGKSAEDFFTALLNNEKQV